MKKVKAYKNKTFKSETQELFQGNRHILMLFIIVLSLSFFIGSIFEPFIMQSIFNTYSEGDSLHMLKTSFAAFGMLILYIVLEYTMAANGDPWAVKLENYGMTKSFFRYHQLPSLQKNHYEEGEVYNRLSEGVSGITWIWFQIAFVGANGIAVVCLSIWAINISWILLVFAGLIILLCFWRIAYQGKRIEQFVKQEQEIKGVVDTQAEFYFRNYTAILQGGSSEAFLEDYEKQRKKRWDVLEKKNNLQLVLDGMEGIVVKTSENILLFVLYQLFQKGEVQIGQIAASQILFTNLKNKVLFLRGFVTQLPQCMVPFRRWQELMDSKPKESKLFLKENGYAIEVSNLNYSYGERELFHNLSFSINHKEKVAILGENGSGKSTLLKLLMGVYSCTSGEIWVEGENPEAFCYDKRRSVFSYAPSRCQLFHESLRDNIRMGAEEIEISGIEKLLIEFGLTALQENNAVEVSAGQAQRTNLSRAWVHHAEIYILDEPTAALDQNLIKVFYEKLKELDSTVIVVTHDHENLEYFDKVITINQIL